MLISRISLKSILFLLLCVPAVLAGDNDWRPVTPAELEQKAPKVEPDADRAYEPLKNLFDMFNKSDSHVVTLRQK